VVIDLPAGDAGPAAGDSAVPQSGGPGRNTHPSPSRPEKASESTADGSTPDANWFDPSAVGGLLGVSADASPSPAGATSDAAMAASESALPSRDHGSSPSSAVLLGLSLLILLAIAGGAAFRWWDRRPGRYWPA